MGYQGVNQGVSVGIRDQGVGYQGVNQGVPDSTQASGRPPGQRRRVASLSDVMEQASCFIPAMSAAERSGFSLTIPIADPRSAMLEISTSMLNLILF